MYTAYGWWSSISGAGETRPEYFSGALGNLNKTVWNNFSKLQLLKTEKEQKKKSFRTIRYFFFPPSSKRDFIELQNNGVVFKLFLKKKTYLKSKFQMYWKKKTITIFYACVADTSRAQTLFRSLNVSSIHVKTDIIDECANGKYSRKKSR